MPQNSVEFSPENLKKVMEFEKVSVNKMGKFIASQKSISENAGIREIQRYRKDGRMPKLMLDMIANYLNVPVFVLKTPTAPDMITEESLKEWESQITSSSSLYSVSGGKDILINGISNMFASQGYALFYDNTKEKYIFGDNNAYMRTWSITEDEYKAIIQPVIDAVNQSASSFKAQLLNRDKKGGVNNGND